MERAETGRRSDSYIVNGWAEHLALGISPIDFDHSLIFTALALLETELRLRARTLVIAQTAKFLDEHCRSHFLREEMVMEMMDSPYLAQHQQEHADGLRFMEYFFLAISLGTRWEKALATVAAWWSRHIREADSFHFRNIPEISGLYTTSREMTA